MALVRVDIDTVPLGTMVYNSAGIPLGVVRTYHAFNGNRPPRRVRHLDNGRWQDRHAYRRQWLYEDAKKAGVFVLEPREADGGVTRACMCRYANGLFEPCCERHEQEYVEWLEQQKEARLAEGRQSRAPLPQDDLPPETR